MIIARIFNGLIHSACSFLPSSSTPSLQQAAFALQTSTINPQVSNTSLTAKDPGADIKILKRDEKSAKSPHAPEMKKLDISTLFEKSRSAGNNSRDSDAVGLQSAEQVGTNVVHHM